MDRVHVQAVRQLRVGFVMARVGVVQGTLEPYISPDCQCAVTTMFVGALQENEIKGTYETRNASNRVLVRGFWQVSRSAPTPDR